jgi:hypothetical protein
VFESWLEVTGVDGDLVSTRRTYVFAADGAMLTSAGIRRYPPRPVIEDSLISAGYELADVRGAPKRPGLELVFIARKLAMTWWRPQNQVICLRLLARSVRPSSHPCITRSVAAD